MQLRDKGNPNLRIRVLDGHIAPDKFGLMTAEVLTIFLLFVIYVFYSKFFKSTFNAGVDERGSTSPGQ